MVSERIAACLASTDDPTTQRDCLDRLDLRSRGPEELADWLCGTDADALTRTTVLQAALVGRPVDDFLDCIDGIQARCGRFTESPVWNGVMRQAEQELPAWAAQVHAELTPERIFGAESEALVQLTEFYLEDGDDFLLAVLEEGGQGFLGGTPAQMDRAAIIAATRLGAGEPYVSFMESLIASPATTSERGMGCTLVAFLTRPGAAIDGSTERALLALHAALDDPRFRLDAANQLIAYHSEEPPRAFEAPDWEPLLRRAERIAAASR